MTIKNSKNNNDNNDNNNNTTSVQDPHMILKLTNIYGTMTMIYGTYLQLWSSWIFMDFTSHGLTNTLRPLGAMKIPWIWCHGEEIVNILNVYVCVYLSMICIYIYVYTYVYIYINKRPK